MILTVTPNTALDRIMFIEEWESGKTQYPEPCIDAIGGKGLDVSFALKCLGKPSLAMGFIAGQVGKTLTGLLDNQQIRHRLTWVNGETRIAHVIVETKKHQHSHITTKGFTVSGKDTQKFLREFSKQIRKATWMVSAGTLSPGLETEFFRTIVDLANQHSVHSLIDSKGLPVLKVLASKPSIIKMNKSEFQGTFSVKTPTIGEITKQGRVILEKNNLPALVITCGGDGILAMLPGETLHAQSPAQVEVNAAGAGDAVSAGLVSRLAEGKSWKEALQWGSAAGAATVLTEATAECRLDDVQRIYNKTTVKIV
jgi:1-phosphofructokinase family hexose kinase